MPDDDSCSTPDVFLMAVLQAGLIVQDMNGDILQVDFFSKKTIDDFWAFLFKPYYFFTNEIP